MLPRWGHGILSYHTKRCPTPENRRGRGPGGQEVSRTIFTSRATDTAMSRVRKNAPTLGLLLSNGHQGRRRGLSEAAPDSAVPLSGTWDVLLAPSVSVPFSSPLIPGRRGLPGRIRRNHEFGGQDTRGGGCSFDRNGVAVGAAAGETLRRRVVGRTSAGPLPRLAPAVASSG